MNGYGRRTGTCAHRDAGQENRCSLGLVLQSELVRFGTSVHAGQGAEHCIDDEVSPADREEDKCWHRDAQCDAYSSKVIVACRGNPVKGAHGP